MQMPLYSTQAWAEARQAALDRDGHRCTVARLLGGPCADVLDVHHLIPVREGGPPLDLDNLVTACKRHHPRLEAIRRTVLEHRERKAWRRCPHPPGAHRTRDARRICERNLNRHLTRNMLAA